MEYNGKLYGKLGGQMYFDTGKTSEDWDLLEKKSKENESFVNEVRAALARYMESEGCSCCRGRNHEQNGENLAILLGVDKYDDGSGYDWSKYR